MSASVSFRADSDDGKALLRWFAWLQDHRGDRAELRRVHEPMSMGATEENLDSHLPPGARMLTLEAGHFLHIERPREVADLALEWLT